MRKLTRKSAAHVNDVPRHLSTMSRDMKTSPQPGFEPATTWPPGNRTVWTSVLLRPVRPGQRSLHVGSVSPCPSCSCLSWQVLGTLPNGCAIPRSRTRWDRPPLGFDVLHQGQAVHAKRVAHIGNSRLGDVAIGFSSVTTVPLFTIAIAITNGSCLNILDSRRWQSRTRGLGSA